MRKNIKVHVKKGDRVIVLSGSDKGKEGEVLRVFPKKYRAIVDNINMVKKHMKPTQENAGGIVDQAAPIHISNLMVVDPKTSTPTRIGRKKDDNGKLKRFSKRTGEIID